MTPTIYLFFKGDCLEAMTRYAQVLGGRIEGVFRNGDVADPAERMPGGDDLVMNMALRLGDTLIMASDNSDEMYERPQGFAVTLETSSREEFDRVYAGLAGDARSVTMPPSETFWAERFAMFRDRHEIPFMLSFAGSKAAAT